VARFDLYRIKAWRIPLVVAVQSDLLDELDSRVVIPLRAAGPTEMPSLPRLNPVLDIDGHRHVLETTDLGAQPLYWLGAPIGNIKEHRDTITAAMDFLFQGY
jgi:toxin CcdB